MVAGGGIVNINREQYNRMKTLFKYKPLVRYTAGQGGWHVNCFMTPIGFEFNVITMTRFFVPFECE
jgi:uncharacterized protein YyaL (SSP411 family)